MVVNVFFLLKLNIYFFASPKKEKIDFFLVHLLTSLLWFLKVLMNHQFSLLVIRKRTKKKGHYLSKKGPQSFALIRVLVSTFD